ncbi:hypothetical protein VNO80_22036 [Phaseolus coccineus]|uniref:Response regulatory domain-containing protein n=1 Tax=Phaseolus coccineus TaxID=3886 RepID=A0AAN9M4C2_PHACN
MAKISSPAIDSKDTVEVPSTLTVLAIDTDLTVLEFIKKECNKYGNQVMVCTDSLHAVTLLREREERTDLILIEVHMPSMDGYEFLQLVNREEINVPLIMMSLDDIRPSITKAIKLGASDYWIKPLHEYQFKSMWTHVLKKYISEDKAQKDTGSMEDDNKIRGRSDNSDFASSMVYRSNSNFREADDVDESNPSSIKKKNRVVWSPEMHLEFVEAIEKTGGIENAVPKKILEVMDTPGLERAHVASHLQKYRKFLKQQEQQQQNEMSSVSGNTEPLPATTLTNFHAEQTLAPDFPLATFPNMGITNFSQFMGIADDGSIYRLYSLSDKMLSMLQRNNMQQSRMHHNQIHPMNFQPSSIIISGNPASVPQNYNFGMNMDHGLISSQSIQVENGIGEVIRKQYTTRSSIYYPHLQNTGDYSQNSSTDIDDEQWIKPSQA